MTKVAILALISFSLIESLPLLSIVFALLALIITSIELPEEWNKFISLFK